MDGDQEPLRRVGDHCSGEELTRAAGREVEDFAWDMTGVIKLD